MKHFLLALTSENTSVSAMRVMSLSCCLAAIIIAFIGVYKPQPDYSGLSMLCGTFLSIAFTGKAYQKSVELSVSKGSSVEK